MMTKIIMISKFLSTLLERWKLKTHAFHFSCEQVIITMESVILIIDFAIDEQVIIEASNINAEYK